MLLSKLFESITKTGKSQTAVVGWGRGMGHKGHMMLASSVITKAKQVNGDPYFVVSRTVGKDDPITPDEKLAIYKKVFPQHGHIFQAASDEIPDLTKVLHNLNQQGYQNCVVVVGADQVAAFQYLKKYNGVANKSGEIPFKFDNLEVISRQETGDPSAGEEGPRATPMRKVLMDPNASDEEKFRVWRDAMSPEVSDDEVRNLMYKAQERMAGYANKTRKQGVMEGEGEQMSKTKALNALRKQLMDEYPYMKCGNLEEFKQRLQWLSEGMLKNHLTNDRDYKINQEEIDLYQAYRKKREQIQQGSQGVAEGNDFNKCFDKACKLYDKAEHKNLQPKLVQVADFKGDGSGADKRWNKLPQHVWQHYVVIVGDQVLDPTAQQFGTDMPTKYNVSDLDKLWGKQYQIRPKEGVAEGWSEKYKRSINCSHPKGFSQRAHCAGKKKHNESTEMEMVCPECGMCQTHGDNLSEIKQRLDAKCWKGKHKEGTKIKGGVRVNNCVPNEDIEEDWQKVNKHDKTDGMSSKAVKAYRREHPGSKLKTAVTTKPSKLKKGSKSAKRRKSFCARMSGMKKAHASAKTKRDPDSPINKALRRWNCESTEHKTTEGLKDPKDNPCWKGYKPVGTKKKAGKTVPNCVPVSESIETKMAKLIQLLENKNKE